VSFAPGDDFVSWLYRQGCAAPESPAGRLDSVCAKLGVTWDPNCTLRDVYLQTVMDAVSAIRMETEPFIGTEPCMTQAALDALKDVPTEDAVAPLFHAAWQGWFVYLATTGARRDPPVPAPPVTQPIAGSYPGPWQKVTSGQSIWTRSLGVRVIAFVEQRFEVDAALGPDAAQWVYSTPTGATFPAQPNTLAGACACADAAGRLLPTWRWS
jgi:hypothetical protein